MLVAMKGKEQRAFLTPLAEALAALGARGLCSAGPAHVLSRTGPCPLPGGSLSAALRAACLQDRAQVRMQWGSLAFVLFR